MSDSESKPQAEPEPQTITPIYAMEYARNLLLFPADEQTGEREQEAKQLLTQQFDYLTAQTLFCDPHHEAWGYTLHVAKLSQIINSELLATVAHCAVFKATQISHAAARNLCRFFFENLPPEEHFSLLLWFGKMTEQQLTDARLFYDKMASIPLASPNMITVFHEALLPYMEDRLNRTPGNIEGWTKLVLKGCHDPFVQ